MFWHEDSAPCISYLGEVDRTTNLYESLIFYMHIVPIVSELFRGENLGVRLFQFQIIRLAVTHDSLHSCDL